MQKQVKIIATYYHKTDGKLNGTVTYLVRASNGIDTYCTTVVNGKASGCSCPAKKGCYHKSQLEKREQKRREVASQFAAKVLPVWAVKLVETGKLVKVATEAGITADQAKALLPIAVELRQDTKHTDMMSAVLTTNKGFQLMR